MEFKGVIRILGLLTVLLLTSSSSLAESYLLESMELLRLSANSKRACIHTDSGNVLVKTKDIALEPGVSLEKVRYKRLKRKKRRKIKSCRKALRESESPSKRSISRCDRKKAARRKLVSDFEWCQLLEFDLPDEEQNQDPVDNPDLQTPEEPEPDNPDTGSDQDSFDPDQGLGSVSLIMDSCAGQASDLINTTCRTLSVSCPDVPEIEVEVRLSVPSGVSLGTVVFGGGGAGGGWYERSGSGMGINLLNDLLSDGFQVVQRRWNEAWEAGPGGMAAVSCRYATLLTWINDNLKPEGSALCASGNSGGGAEIAYALALWNRDTILDLAVPTGGPPLSRLDLGCLMPSEWVNQCLDIFADYPMQCDPTEKLDGSCGFGGSASNIDIAYSPVDTPCSDEDLSFEAEFLADSIISEGALFNYPNTFVHFVQGDGDCSSAFSMGVLYYQEILKVNPAMVAFDIALDTPHSVQSTVEGVEAIYNAIVGGCFVR